MSEIIDLILQQYAIEDKRRDYEVQAIEERESDTIRTMSECAGIDRLRAISLINERILDNIKYILAHRDTVVDLAKEINITIENGEQTMEEIIDEINEDLKDDIEAIEVLTYDEIDAYNIAMETRLNDNIWILIQKMK